MSFVSSIIYTVPIFSIFLLKLVNKVVMCIFAQKLFLQSLDDIFGFPKHEIPCLKGKIIFKVLSMSWKMFFTGQAYPVSLQSLKRRGPQGRGEATLMQKQHE